MTELVQAVFKGLFGLALIAAVTWLSWAGRISDQLAGGVYGVAAAYAFHLSAQAAAGLNGVKNSVLHRNGREETKEA